MCNIYKIRIKLSTLRSIERCSVPPLYPNTRTLFFKRVPPLQPIKTQQYICASAYLLWSPPVLVPDKRFIFIPSLDREQPPSLYCCASELFCLILCEVLICFGHSTITYLTPLAVLTGRRRRCRRRPLTYQPSRVQCTTRLRSERTLEDEPRKNRPVNRIKVDKV